MCESSRGQGNKTLGAEAGWCGVIPWHMFVTVNAVSEAYTMMGGAVILLSVLVFSMLVSNRASKTDQSD